MEDTVTNIDELREIAIICKDFGVAHFERGDLILEFFRPEKEEEEDDEIAGFQSVSSGGPAEETRDDDDEDDEVDTRPGYTALFGKKVPKFRSAKNGD